VGRFCSAGAPAGELCGRGSAAVAAGKQSDARLSASAAAKTAPVMYASKPASCANSAPCVLLYREWPAAWRTCGSSNLRAQRSVATHGGHAHPALPA
jgi:hypothetical protein